MLYLVEFSKSAVRQFEKLSKSVQTRLRPRIDALARDPRPHGVKKLGGEDELYRLRVGDYRIIYQIQDKVLLVLVVRIGNAIQQKPLVCPPSLTGAILSDKSRLG